MKYGVSQGSTNPTLANPSLTLFFPMLIVQPHFPGRSLRKMKQSYGTNRNSQSKNNNFLETTKWANNCSGCIPSVGELVKYTLRKGD